MTTRAGRLTAPLKLHLHFYLAAALLLLAFFGFNYWFEHLNRLQMAGNSVPLKKPLSTVPRELGEWTLLEGYDEDGKLKLSAEALYITGVKDYLNRIYLSSKEMRSRKNGEGSSDKGGLQVYVAYWGGIRHVAPHRPDVCMRGAGWAIAGAYRREVDLTMASGVEKIGVNVNVFTKDYNRQMIVWWEYIHGRNVTNPFLERIRWVLPVFLGGKSGSVVQVQISKDVAAGESEDEVYEKILTFARQLAPEIGKCLPEPQ